MSDTVAAADEAAPPAIPNYSATPKTETLNGQIEQWLIVKYGQDPADQGLPQSVLEIRKVDMGDQFDLAEIAGLQVDNEVWMSLAIVGLSVQKINGTPIPRGNLSKASIRNTLRAIGPLGVRAVRQALYTMNGITDDKPVAEREKAAAGN